ncbi:MAG: GNAT family N-acetyltransferase [Gammaproteobacteria bacterium]|nr:GNAT family N-acetyltransferase [Gammaproteobacteria bacterium]
MLAPSSFRACCIDSLSALPAADWNRLTDGNPLLRHEFLLAIEESGCVGAGTAWQPSYLVLRDANERLIGALPLYLKYDSRGEFVFDWSWADAYERAGLDYYPKLVSAVPFTPAGGPRLLVAGDADNDAVRDALVGEALRFAQDNGVSSWHVLFPSESERRTYQAAGLLERKSCQFHWHNDGYRDFDDFLSRFNSAKRKKAKRERRRIAEAGIYFEHLPGDAVSASDWDAVYEFYSRTFHRRGRSPYLNRDFFDRIVATMPENLLIVLARFDRHPIATAICFRGSDTLYGRYWGSAADFHSLHFEACYYQGIDYCIREKIALFEPGTQGEHKISRGFLPTATWSFHWLKEPAFYDAIQEYLVRETSHVDSYMEHWDAHLPYRSGAIGTDRL